MDADYKNKLFKLFSKKCLTKVWESVEYASRLRGEFIKKIEDKLCGRSERSARRDKEVRWS
ncbi:MAG: hypothetical protein J0I93_13025, partial [Legionella sp.]|nr:hypothetical protein [Legionella sp.]